MVQIIDEKKILNEALSFIIQKIKAHFHETHYSERIIEDMLVPLIHHYRQELDEEVRRELSQFMLNYMKSNPKIKDPKLIKAFTDSMVRDEEFLNHLILEMLSLKEKDFILNFFSFFLKSNKQKYSAGLLMTFINFFNSLSFEFLPLELNVLESIIYKLIQITEFSTDDHQNIINSLYNSFFLEKPVFNMAFLKNLLDSQTLDDQVMHLVAEKVTFILENIEKLIDKGMKEPTLRDKLLGIILSILSKNRLYSEIQ